MEKIKIIQHSFTGLTWVVCWMFTIGFLSLSFGQGILAIIIWPYYIGRFLAILIH